MVGNLARKRRKQRNNFLFTIRKMEQPNLSYINELGDNLNLRIR
jgi:hypothetical protein